MQSLFHVQGQEIADEQCPEVSGKCERLEFKFGFHAIPSLRQLHMHVISQDLSGTAMKNKKHWNSFTTDFFIPASRLLAELETRGSIWVDSRAAENLLKSRLRCHKCNCVIPSFAKLKEHILDCKNDLGQ